MNMYSLYRHLNVQITQFPEIDKFYVFGLNKTNRIRVLNRNLNKPLADPGAPPAPPNGVQFFHFYQKAPASEVGAPPMGSPGSTTVKTVGNHGTGGTTGVPLLTPPNWNPFLSYLYTKSDCSRGWHPPTNGVGAPYGKSWICNYMVTGRVSCNKISCSCFGGNLHFTVNI